MNRDIHRRVVRLERERNPEAPTRIFSDRPMNAGEGMDLLLNWREHVASGMASVSGTSLCVMRQEPMTEDDWVKEYATEH